MTKGLVALLLTLVLFMSASSQTQSQPSQTKTPAKKAAPKKFPIGEGRVGTGAISAKMNVAPDLNQRLAKWKPIKVPFNATKLSARERQMVEKLVLACQMLEDARRRLPDRKSTRLNSSHSH